MRKHQLTPLRHLIIMLMRGLKAILKIIDTHMLFLLQEVVTRFQQTGYLFLTIFLFHLLRIKAVTGGPTDHQFFIRIAKYIPHLRIADADISY